jgi:hypothetical protein
MREALIEFSSYHRVYVRYMSLFGKEVRKTIGEEAAWPYRQNTKHPATSRACSLH